jgi:flagellar hook protein FlgE
MSFQQGLSGLNATSKSLEVIGNNIANASTIGAKSARAEFADMYAASLNGAGASAVGIGTRIGAVAQMFTQGNISTTQNEMDLAINGRGFFMLSEPSGREVYSRNGQFSLDRDGNIVNAQGAKLLGRQWSEAVDRAEGDPQPIQLPAGGGNWVKTGSGADPRNQGVRLRMNLDAQAGVIAEPDPTRVGTATDPVPLMRFGNPSTYNFSTAQTVFDGIGLPLTLTYYFQKTDINQWSVYATIDGGDGAKPLTWPTGTPFDPNLNAPGAPIATLAFGPDGALTTASAAAATTNVIPTINDPRAIVAPGADVLFTDLPFRLADSNSGVTQFGAGFSVSELRQDGFPPGQLTGFQFDGNGIVKATYSNGRTVNLAQLVLADFANVQGLKPLGNNVWESTFLSGAPTRNAPGQSSAGLIQSGALEESNIDLTAELVNMITAQRIYQANAQTIKTIDQTMQTLVNLR